MVLAMDLHVHLTLNELPYVLIIDRNRQGSSERYNPRVKGLYLRQNGNDEEVALQSVARLLERAFSGPIIAYGEKAFDDQVVVIINKNKYSLERILAQ